LSDENFQKGLLKQPDGNEKLLLVGRKMINFSDKEALNFDKSKNVLQKIVFP